MRNQNEILQQLRIPTIHTLRGIAALAVCLFHFVNFTTGLFDDQSVREVFRYGKYGVQMFFVISGFVIPYSMYYGGYKLKFLPYFLKKRFVRLEPTYLISICLALLILYLKNHLVLQNQVATPTLTNIALHIGYMIPFFENEPWINVVYWTLAIEFQYYFLISFLFPLIFSDSFIIRNFSTIMICLAGLLFNNEGFLLVHLPCFMFGISYVQYKVGRTSKWEMIFTLVLSSVMLFYYRGFTELIVGQVTLLIIFLLPTLRSRITDFLGNISYSLYLLHTITGTVALNFLTHRAHNTGEKIIAVLIAVIVSVISAYIMYRLIEKPSHELAKRISLIPSASQNSTGDYAEVETKN